MSSTWFRGWGASTETATSPKHASRPARSRRSLFGSERVHVPAGQTASVWLYPALTELAHTPLSGERVARHADQRDAPQPEAGERLHRPEAAPATKAG